MAKPKMVPVSVNLINAIRDLQADRRYSLLPLSLRERIEEGMRGNGHKVRK
ncbi:hypothetical protein LCGC14_1128760 [marine sediment metagenome]|uniref:Uncharacterized protein n=1 Tax=marine sediment metagenome TaxID=412755 RepID=A0A0F9M1X6_9ZZZZ